MWIVDRVDFSVVILKLLLRGVCLEPAWGAKWGKRVLYSCRKLWGAQFCAGWPNLQMS
jgi:hypothetical protein